MCSTIERLVKKNEVNLPSLFGIQDNIQVSRVQLQELLQLVKAAQLPPCINGQIKALEAARQMLEKWLK